MATELEDTRAKSMASQDWVEASVGKSVGSSAIPIPGPQSSVATTSMAVVPYYG